MIGELKDKIKESEKIMADSKALNERLEKRVGQLI